MFACICLPVAVLPVSCEPPEKPTHHDSQFSWVAKAAFSHDGSTLYYLSGDLSSTSVYAWKLSGKERAVKLYSSETTLSDFLLSKDGKQLILAQSRSLILLTLESGASALLHREENGTYICALGLSDDGEDIIIGNSLGDIKTW